MNEALYCRDLPQFGKKLIEFVDAALVEKNKATIVKNFYERLTQATILDYAFSGVIDENKTQYIIYEEQDAVGKLIYLTRPSYTSPVKTLSALRNYGEYIISQYKPPIGKQISFEMVKEILQYLDSKYEFTDKIFSSKKAMICIIDYSHTKFNSECLIFNSDEGLVQHFLIYHMKNDKDDTSPEAVFFHELGHALHAKCYGNTDSVPTPILSFLKDLCFQRINELTLREQVEVFADVISVGLMYDSPFEKFETFPSMHANDKKVFKILVEKMLSRI